MRRAQPAQARHERAGVAAAQRDLRLDEPRLRTGGKRNERSAVCTRGSCADTKSSPLMPSLSATLHLPSLNMNSHTPLFWRTLLSEYSISYSKSSGTPAAASVAPASA